MQRCLWEVWAEARRQYSELGLELGSDPEYERTYVRHQHARATLSKDSGMMLLSTQAAGDCAPEALYAHWIRAQRALDPVTARQGSAFVRASSAAVMRQLVNRAYQELSGQLAEIQLKLARQLGVETGLDLTALSASDHAVQQQLASGAFEPMAEAYLTGVGGSVEMGVGGMEKTGVYFTDAMLQVGAGGVGWVGGRAGAGGWGAAGGLPGAAGGCWGHLIFPQPAHPTSAGGRHRGGRRRGGRPGGHHAAAARR